MGEQTLKWKIEETDTFLLNRRSFIKNCENIVDHMFNFSHLQKTFIEKKKIMQRKKKNKKTHHHFFKQLYIRIQFLLIIQIKLK